MKLKKRIVENWSLEAKDNYQLLREKLDFVECSAQKKHFPFKAISFALVSFVIVFVAISFGFTITNMTKNDPSMEDSYFPSNPGMDNDIMKPDDNDHSPEGDSPNDDKEETKPGEPEIESEYNLFIESLNNLKIDIDKLYLLEYFNADNEKFELKDFETVVKYFNNLQYIKKESVIDNQMKYDHKILFNNDWLVIYFSDINVIAFAYEDAFIEYTVNTKSVYEDLKESLLN